jgi:hypothetical protein
MYLTLSVFFFFLHIVLFGFDAYYNISMARTVNLESFIYIRTSSNLRVVVDEEILVLHLTSKEDKKKN